MGQGGQGRQEKQAYMSLTLSETKRSNGYDAHSQWGLRQKAVGLTRKLRFENYESFTSKFLMKCSCRESKYRRSLIITKNIVLINATSKILLPLEGKAIYHDSDLKR